MRRMLVLPILAAVAMACVSCSTANHQTRQGPAPISKQALAKAELQYYWNLQRSDLGLDEGESLVEFYLLDENLYAITDHDRLFCIDAARGLVKWSCEIPTNGEKIYKPSHADRALLAARPLSTTQMSNRDAIIERSAFRPVLINTTSRLFVFNRDTGDLVRDIRLSFVAVTGSATDGVCAYLGTAQGNFASVLLDEAVSNWTMGTGGPIKTSPVVSGGYVYVGSSDGTVRCAATSREPRAVWQKDLGGPVNAPLTVTPKACLVPCDDYRLYAFAPTTGAAMWKQPFVTNGQLRTPPQLGPNTIYQYARNDKFYAITLLGGTTLWESQSARAVLALMDHNAYLVDADNNLQIVEEATGSVKAKLPLSGYDLFVGNTTSPAIYVAHHSGRLACIRPMSAGYLKPSDMPAEKK